KPDEVPSAGIDGGLIGMISAGWYDAKCLAVRASTACTERSEALRCDQSLKRTNTIPWFWPRPAKLKPAISYVICTAVASCFMTYCATSSSDCSVTACVVPGGACTMT